MAPRSSYYTRHREMVLAKSRIKRRTERVGRGCKECKKCLRLLNSDNIYGYCETKQNRECRKWALRNDPAYREQLERNLPPRRWCKRCGDQLYKSNAYDYCSKGSQTYSECRRWAIEHDPEFREAFNAKTRAQRGRNRVRLNQEEVCDVAIADGDGGPGAAVLDRPE